MRSFWSGERASLGDVRLVAKDTKKSRRGGRERHPFGRRKRSVVEYERGKNATRRLSEPTDSFEENIHERQGKVAKGGERSVEALSCKRGAVRPRKITYV